MATITTDAVEILHRRYFAGRPKRLAELEEARASAEVARKVFDLRESTGLTQRQLAKLVRTTASVSAASKTPNTRGTLFPCSGESPRRWIGVSKSGSCR